MTQPEHHICCDRDALAPERVVASKLWIENELHAWRRSYKPDPLDLVAMAIALEEIADAIRRELRHLPTPHTPHPTPHTPHPTLHTPHSTPHTP